MKNYTNAILKGVDNESFYLSELPDGQRHGSHEYKAHCPFKDLHANGDRSPSFTVNLRTGLYYCNTCKSKGNIHTYLMNTRGLSSLEAWLTLGDNLGLPRPSDVALLKPPIDSALPMKYHLDLLASKSEVLTVLQDYRGLNLETIRKFQIGWDGERITIPIYNENYELVNIRRYKWDAPTPAQKFVNYVDHLGNKYGELQLYGVENLLDPTIKEIIYPEGELDRLVLEQIGYKAVTPTSGTGSFKNEWCKLFKGKIVTIIQDNDEAGVNGSRIIAERLKRYAVEIRIAEWPSDFTDKGDPTDWFVKYKGTVEGLKKVIDEAPVYSSTKKKEPKDDEIIDVHLAVAGYPEYLGKKQRVPVMVSGKDTAPYLAPKKVRLSCSCDTKACEYCKLNLEGGTTEVEFDASIPDTLLLIQCSKDQQIATIKHIAGVNPKCNRVNLEVVESMNIEEIRVIPQTENEYSGMKDSEYVSRKCFYIGKSIKTNQKYNMLGYTHAEPRSQYVTSIFDKAIPVQDRADSFKMTPEVFEELSIFCPKEGQSVADKFEEIHKDFERNVTRVWERRNLSKAVDLIYHTALSFNFQEQFIRKGWAELLVIGDSGQAKSTLVERLQAHYRLGDFYSGESSKRTGLVYNLQQTQKRWFLNWGAYPLNDGGLLVIDEFSGIPEDDLALMSEVRSSGVARVTGVITAETNARTRGIFLSNPRNGMQLNAETHGVQAVLKLFGKAEDVRRVDLVVGVASGDVDVRLINRDIYNIEKVPHIYTSELCRKRVLWCWSRKPNQIVFTKEATAKILESATEMGKKYSSKIPIVEAADQRLKLARLSIAAAGCMFSTDDGTNIIVKPDHVEFVVNFMNEVYDHKNLDYKGFSDTNRIYTAPDASLVASIRKQFSTLPLSDLQGIADVLYGVPYFNTTDARDIIGASLEDTSRFVSFLFKNKLIDKTSRGYRKTSLGILVIKDMIENPLTDKEIEDNRRESYKGSEY